MTKLRAVAALCLLVGCAHSSATLDRARLAPIKRVAVVQYAFNPTVPGLFGLDAAAVGLDAAANGRAGWPSLVAARIDRFSRELTRRWSFVPLQTVAATPVACEGGRPEVAGWVTAPGMCMFYNEDRYLKAAELHPDYVHRLTEGLDVDAVFVISEMAERWTTAHGNSVDRKLFKLNLYDRSGVRVWSDQAYGRAGWTQGREREEEYFTSALEVFRDHLANP